jgi:hypothetical protein
MFSNSFAEILKGNRKHVLNYKGTMKEKNGKTKTNQKAKESGTPFQGSG